MTTTAPAAMYLKRRCQSSGSTSEVIATIAQPATRIDAHDAHRRSFEERRRSRDRRRDAIEQQNHAQGLAGQPANGEVRNGVGGEADAEDTPEGRADFVRKTPIPPERRAARAIRRSAAAPAAGEHPSDATVSHVASRSIDHERHGKERDADADRHAGNPGRRPCPVIEARSCPAGSRGSAVRR